MAKDVIYTNGVIAVKENKLLRDKLLKLTDMSAEEAFRAVTESGFGKGAEVSSVYEYEKLLSAEEAELDEFIREYAPTEAEKAYFLTPRDFHNAKALFKAELLGAEPDKMLAPDGLIPRAEIAECIKSKDCSRLPAELGEALVQAYALAAEGDITGAEIGVIFDKALYKRLFAACSKNLFLKRLLVKKADMNNILTAVRSDSFEFAEKCFVGGGKLKSGDFTEIFSEDEERAARALDKTRYAEFYRLCLGGRREGKPLSEAEKHFESFETAALAERKYDLKRDQPFLYYVLRRRAEITDVRIIFVCLLAGYDGRDIRGRLRPV